MTTIAVIGAGPWGQNIIRDLVQLDVDVVVAARSLDSQAAAHNLGASRVVDRPESLPDLDGVVIATSASTHSDMIMRVCSRDTPIFCEKPFVLSHSNAVQLRDLCGDQIFMMDKWRYSAPVLELAAIARSHEFGPVLGLQLMRHSTSLGHTDTDLGWILWPHDLAIAREILGAYPSVAHATGQRINGRLVVANVHMTGPGGESLVIDSSAIAEASSRRITLHCHDAIVQLSDGLSDSLTITRGANGIGLDRNVLTRTCNGEPPLRAELRSFVNYVEGGVAPKSTIDDAVTSVSLIESIYNTLGKN